MNDFKSNSRTPITKTDQASIKPKEIEKVITGKAIKRNRSPIRKAADSFISEDLSKIKDYVVKDVLIPTIKRALSDIITNGTDIMLWGETGHSSKLGRSNKFGYSNYATCYDRVKDPREERRAVPRNSYDYGDIVLETRGEAEVVLASMDDFINQYGTVSVADLYDLCDLTGNYTDNKYGWIDLKDAKPMPCPGGYFLSLPKAIPLN